MRETAMRRHAVWMLLIAAALMMRALVPQGWMPDSDGEGVFAVRPCSSAWALPEEPMQMSAHAGHEEMGGAGDHSEHLAADPCAFAGFGMPGLAGDDFAVLTAPLLAPQPFDRTRSDAIVVAQRRTLPPARAPPLPA